MRVTDRPLPVVTLDTVETIAAWPVRPVIALYSTTFNDKWDDPTVLWDEADSHWDDGWKDATCAWTGMEIDTGEPDDSMLFPASRCLVQLDNRDGEWSTLNADGTHRYGPGSPLSVWAHNATGDWWLFSGLVARYDQRADDTVEIEAFDCFSELAMPVGTFTPGTNGQKMGARLSAVLAKSARPTIPSSFALGVASLTAQETELTPLEEMQMVVLSDGGILFGDSDGTLRAYDRTWPSGRADQTHVLVTSSNVCSAEAVVWDAVLSSNDDSLADRVVLENLATPNELVAIAGAASGYVFALSDQQWTTQTEGNILAQLYLDQMSPRQMSVEEFSLYLNDPQQPNLWKAVDLRRVDHLRFLHDQKTAGGGEVRLDVTAVVDGIIHEVTPEGWGMWVSTSKVRSFTLPTLYDTGHLYDTGEEYGY